jgi:hypothetical protein
MTVFENLARLLPLHIQRIAELAFNDECLTRPSCGRWMDLAGMFIFRKTEEGFDYWDALGRGNGGR